MPDASPFWQNAFLVVVLVAMGWCVWNGWRIGIVRALFSLLGMLVACAVNFFLTIAIGAIAITISPVYGPMFGVVIGAVVALGAYVLIAFLGALLFKRTSQQSTTALRFIYGSGGAFLGVLVGISVFWARLLFVRGMGGMCEASVEGQRSFYKLPMPEPAARALVKLKRSIEIGGTGNLLKSLDVMPAETYRIFDKFGRLLANPEAVPRFLAYPGIQEVLADMHFLQLTSDPEIQAQGRAQDGSALMRNPKMIAAAQDPALIAKLQKIDIEKALDFALSAPSPTPHSASHPPKP